MSTELGTLLALQAQDDVVDERKARLDALAPRLASLDAARASAARLLEESRELVAADEHRQRELEGRIAEHRQRHERNVSHLDAVKRMREATAAMAQVEVGRKLLAEEENELRNLVARVADGHAAIRKQEEGLAELDASQAEARAEIEGERAALDAELQEAQSERTSMADKVDGALAHKYDRIRNRRHSQAVFPLNGMACGCCDTAVPIQRRKMMAITGAIEVCETCGVLMYASN